MSATTIPVHTRPRVDDNDGFFGVCPICAKATGCLNIGKGHWFYCDEHQTKWLRRQKSQSMFLCHQMKYAGSLFVRS